MLRAGRWLWLNAEKYGMDEDRLYVSGHSAGGHLTALHRTRIGSFEDPGPGRTVHLTGELVRSSAKEFPWMMLPVVLKEERRKPASQAVPVKAALTVPGTTQLILPSLPEGWEAARSWNQVIVRTQRGMDLLELARRRGVLEFREPPAENLEKLKAASLGKKNAAASRLYAQRDSVERTGQAG
jgi:hypothetical protein